MLGVASLDYSSRSRHESWGELDSVGVIFYYRWLQSITIIQTISDRSALKKIRPYESMQAGTLRKRLKGTTHLFFTWGHLGNERSASEHVMFINMSASAGLLEPLACYFPSRTELVPGSNQNKGSIRACQNICPCSTFLPPRGGTSTMASTARTPGLLVCCTCSNCVLQVACGRCSCSGFDSWKSPALGTRWPDFWPRQCL